MKALNCKNKILLVFIFLASSGLYAQELKKELHEEFNTNKSSVLSVDGKFCDLTLNSWDKDQAVFDVTIKVEHSNDSKAKKMLDMISVEFEQDGNNLMIETVLDEDFKKVEIGKGNKFSIIIVGSVPSYINLDLETKFGSAELGSFSGNADISTSFGAVEIEQLSGSEISVSVNQGDLSVGNVANADIELKFGSVNIVKAGNLSVECNQGEIKIGTVKSLSAEVNMGSCEVGVVDSDFESIDIEVKSGNVVLGIDKDAGFTIEAEMRMGNIDLPGDLGKMKKDKMGMNTSFEGKYGNGKSQISLEGSLGNIELKLK